METKHKLQKTMTIEERAKEFATSDIKTGLGTITNHVDHFKYNYYLHGSIDQQKIDIEKACDITVKLLKEANVRVPLIMESVIYGKIKQAMEE